jgi:hypothetical protein
MNGAAQVERGAQFQSLIERASETLRQARDLNERAEITADILIGPNGKGPMPSKPPEVATVKPLTVTESLGNLIDRIHGELGEASGHLGRLARELPPQPEKAPPTR